MSNFDKKYSEINVTLNGTASLDTGITGSSRYYVPHLNSWGDLIFTIAARTPDSPLNVGNVRGENFNIRQIYSTFDEMIRNNPNPEVGWAFLVGDDTDGTIYFWNGTTWLNIGTLRGEMAEIEIGDVSIVPPGDLPWVENIGTSNKSVFNFGLPQGEPASINVGETETIAWDEPADVSNSGTPGDVVLDFKIPRGRHTTIQVGEVSTVTSNDPATVVNVGDEFDAIFDFEIPSGRTATVEIGDVKAVDPDDVPSVTNVGTSEDAILDFEIPTGQPGTASVGKTETIDWNKDALVVNSGNPQHAVLDFEIPRGRPATINVGSTTTVTSDKEAKVTNSSESVYDAIFNFELPRGKAATVSVGETDTLEPGELATVENVGTNEDAILDFGIPAGPAATVEVGNVITGLPNQPVVVTNVGDAHNAILEFRIPKGNTGSGLQILGHFNTIDQLRAEHPIGEPGHMYSVGTSIPYDVYIWSETLDDWYNNGPLGGAGHIIFDDEFVQFTQRPSIQFKELDVIDDPINNMTVIHGRPATQEGHTILNGLGLLMPQRKNLQFAGIGTSDDIDNDATVVRGLVAGSGTSYRTEIVLYKDNWKPVNPEKYPLYRGSFFQTWENESITNVTNGTFKLSMEQESRGIWPPNDGITIDGKLIFFINNIPFEDLIGTVILTNVKGDLIKDIFVKTVNDVGPDENLNVEVWAEDIPVKNMGIFDTVQLALENSTYEVYVGTEEPPEGSKVWINPDGEVSEGDIIIDGGVPKGGTTGQILGKASDYDLDTKWLNSEDLPGAVSEQTLNRINRSIEESQWIASITFVLMAESGLIDDITITEHANLFPVWDIYWRGKAGNIVQDDGKLYRSIHNITNAEQNGKPSISPSMWTLVGNPTEEYPLWVQPHGSHDAYRAGARVTHNSKRWENTHGDGNSWEPGVHGWSELP